MRDMTPFTVEITALIHGIKSAVNVRAKVVGPFSYSFARKGRTSWKTSAGRPMSALVGSRLAQVLGGRWTFAQSDFLFRVSETPLPSGHETILVVEDDPGVRTMVVRQLVGLGYRAIEAENGAEALKLARDGVQFDLLFTGMVMPGGLTGAELAKEVRRLRPGAKVLFTSGYTEQAVQGFAASHASLSKPYRKGDLARAIRSALSNQG